MPTSEGVLGFRERFIEAEETNYGEAVALTSANMPGYNLKVMPNFSQGFQEILNDGSDDREVVSKVAGPLSLNYKLSYSPVDWRRLKYVFDIDSETGTSPTTHVLSIGNTLKTYTAEWALRHDSSPIIIKTTGNVVNSTTIDFKKATGEGNEGFVTISQDCIAQNYTTPAIQSGSYTVTGDPFQYRHIVWTLASSAVVEVNNGSITFDQGIDPANCRYASTSLDRTIGTPIPTLFRISGRFNVNLVNSTYMDLWETAAALTGTNTLVFQISASNKTTFTFTGMTVDPVPLSETNMEGINSADFVFTATGVSVVVLDSISAW
jgi:hypothetical protein